jgi:regulator of protease activity HflC (stomatin/prohibitin superfamily)
MIRTYIKQHEIGLVFRRGDLSRVLEPGRHILPERLLPDTRIEKHSMLDTRFRHDSLDTLVENETLRSHLEIVDLSEDDRAVVWRNGCLYDFVGSGRYAYWKTPHTLKVEAFNVAEVEFRHPQRDAIMTMPQAPEHLLGVDVDSHERLLVRRGGELVGVYGGGRHAFWSRGRLITWTAVDMREQIADVAGQEIMTADKVTLRLNLVVAWRVTDPERSTSVVDNAAGAVYREAQLALRAAVGTRELDRLLSDKDKVANEVRASITPRASGFGVAIASVGIRDIVLPGEMKTILNQVIEAEKKAEANLIRRREETAAARSQANTAKLLAEHPVLLRMKELESLEAILRDARTTFVFGSGDITRQVKSLIASGEQE